jgi:ribosomal protein L11 methyltransferase
VIRLAVRVAAGRAELVLAELLELAPGGVEEVALPGGIVEYAVYGAPGELPSLPALKAAAGGALVEITTSELADDWDARWREFHRPLVVDGRLTVRPPWEPVGDTALEVVIDPGRAFGTGAHPTTRMCLELLLELPPHGAFLDLGCGSGVLAITAARLGFSPVIALDSDPAAIEATRANARRNGVRLEAVRRVDLRSECPPLAGATVAANLLRGLLVALADRSSPASPPARVIAGGLLAAEADGVARAFARRGLRELERRVAGDWVALLLGAALG